MDHIPVLTIPVPDLRTANRRARIVALGIPFYINDRVEEWASGKAKGRCKYLCARSETQKVEERENETACMYMYIVKFNK